MKLEGVRVKAFRSYKAEQVLDLSTLPPGVYHVCGTNGAGKSTLFDAVHWVLVGETSRGLRATGVSSWGIKKGCEGSVLLDGSEVSRGWSPNYLRVDGDEVDQEQLMQALQLTPEVILNTFYFSQFADFFLDLKPPQRMELYSTVLGLDLWETRSDLAAQVAKQYAQEARAAELEETKYRERASTLLSVDYTELIKEWQRTRQERLDRAEAEGAQLDEQLTEKQAEKGRQEASVQKLLDIAKKANDRSEAANRAWRATSTALTRAEANEEHARKQARAAAQQLKDFDNLEEGPCFACGQPVTKAHKAKHRRHLAAEEIEANEAYEAACAAHKAAKEADAAAEAVWNAASPAQADNALAAQRKQLERTEDAIEALQGQLERLLEQYEATQAEANPFELQQRKSAAQASQAAKDADQWLAALQEAQRLEAKFAFWVKGFKDVRYQVMQESLAQLNAEVNECLHDLGLDGWQLEFQVEHETKRGTVKRGFLCNVLSPDSPDSVPWEAWSGGESQRLRIGAQMGVSNMISSRLGLDPDFEFWDEPSTWLNEDGIKNMLSVLQERAQRYGRRIFLADHRALDFEFDGTLYVNKTEGGSELKPSWE